MRNQTTPTTRTLTIDDVICDGASYKPDALRAVKRLARTKPWKGDFIKRFGDIIACSQSLAEAYGIAVKIKHVGHRNGCSGASRISPDGKRIVLTGRLSVVTMLHLFAKARQIQKRGTAGLNHFKAIRWSATLFRRKFPISFGRCKLVGGLLVNAGRRDG
jgi:hypothetical protein